MKNFIVGLFTSLALLSATAAAGQFEDAQAAYRKGDFAQVLKLFQPLAVGAQTLSLLAKAVSAKRVIPIHSFAPERLCELVRSVTAVDDGEWIVI